MRKLSGEKGKNCSVKCSCLALVQGLSVERERDIDEEGEEEECLDLQN